MIQAAAVHLPANVIVPGSAHALIRDAPAEHARRQQYQAQRHRRNDHQSDDRHHQRRQPVRAMV